MTSRFRTTYSALSRLLSFNSTTAHSGAAAAAAEDAAAAASSSSLAVKPDLSFPTQLAVKPDLESRGELAPEDTLIKNSEPPGWKRTGKVVQTVGLGGVGMSVTLIVNSPPSAATHVALYTAYLSFVGLGLFSGMGLSFFSILMKGSPSVGWVQTRLMCFTLFFVAIACFLRLHLALPLAESTIGTASILFGVAAMVIYLCVGWRRPESIIS